MTADTVSMEISIKERIERPGFQIWLHEKVIEQELRNFVLNMVSNEVQNMCNLIWAPIKKKFASQCTSCETQDLLHCPTNTFCKRIVRGVCPKHGNVKLWRPKPCPQHLCDNFKEKVDGMHKFIPCWENTDAKCWATSDFEVAKCFLPIGYDKKKSLDEVDLVGLLHICINCLAFKTWISHWRHPENAATKVCNLFKEMQILFVACVSPSMFLEKNVFFLHKHFFKLFVCTSTETLYVNHN